MSGFYDYRQGLWEQARKEIKEFMESRGIEEPRCGFHICPGWIPPVFKALDEMIAAGWDKNLSQVKQKFGGLRIYIGAMSGPAKDRVREIISETEALVDTMCEYCGKPHGRTIPLSGTALCQECNDLTNRLAQEEIHK